MTRRFESIAWREGISLFWALSIGITISLISQTYNISGDLPRFLLVWALLILPIGYLLDAVSSFAVYSALILFWAGFSMSVHNHAVLFWILFFAIVPYFVRMFFHHIETIRFAVLSWIFAVTFCFALGIALTNNDSALWLALYGSLFSLFYLFGKSNVYSGRTLAYNPFIAIPAAAIPLLSLVLTNHFVWDNILPYKNVSFPGSASPHWAVIIDYSAAIILFLSALILFYHAIHRKKVDYLSNIFFLLMGACYGLIRFEIASSEVFMTIFNIYVFLYALVEITKGVFRNKLSQMNYGMIILFILVLLRFFDSDIPFIVRGIIFIILGSCFLGANLFMIRRSAHEKK